MKILLVFPPVSLSERYNTNVGDVGGYLPPSGLLYMGAMFEQAGHTVQIMDCEVNDLHQDEVIERISNFQPDMVGISTLTLMSYRTFELSNLIREKFPGIFILIGGPHANAKPEETLAKTMANVVVTGEADEMVVKITENMEKYKTPQIVRCGIVKDIDKLPYPARHLVDLKKYKALPNNYIKSPYVFQMFGSRGCPFLCTYCAESRGIFRQRGIEKVVGEIKHLISTYGMEECVFWDSTFTINRNWVIELCKQIKKENLNFYWSCYTRVNLVDPEMLKNMREAGCWNIFLGIEAGNQQLLNNVKKGVTLDMTRNGVKMIKDAGIEIRASFIFGLPGETPETARETIKFAIELNPDYAQFGLATPFHGTELYDTYQKWGRFDESDYKKFNIWTPVFIPHGYKNSEELVSIQKEAFRRFYMRPKYILGKLVKIRDTNTLLRYLKGLRLVMGFVSPKLVKLISS